LHLLHIYSAFISCLFLFENWSLLPLLCAHFVVGFCLQIAPYYHHRLFVN
jgi:hypothetical protein